MLIVESYSLAVVLCVVTMLCWGSWANTQKLASQEWPFQLFYWDYSVGVLLLTLILAFTVGSSGAEGRSFLPDISQASGDAITTALVGGVVFTFAPLHWACRSALFAANKVDNALTPGALCARPTQIRLSALESSDRACSRRRFFRN